MTDPTSASLEPLTAIAPRRSRAFDVADYLLATIRDRGLVAGDRIGTALELQTSLGVAKSTFAEAVKILVEREQIFAKTGPRGGIFVAEAPADRILPRYFKAREDNEVTMREVMEVRDHLEHLVAHDALDHATDDDLRRLSDAVDALAHAGQDGFVEAVSNFHTIIASAVANSVLRDLYLSLLEFLAGGVVASDEPGSSADAETYLAERVAIHREIFECLTARDHARLADALARHTA
jgi:GntR family transcriptional repressor for pyruvate dehydrogenase complex